MYLSVCVCLYVCLHVCVLSYFSMCTWICHDMYLSTYSLHVLVYILATCTCLHTRYMYLSTYSLHVLVYILTTCTCLHTHYMYLSTYSLHVLVYILTTCTCLQTYYMYLSADGQGDAISTDPKIAPVNDQPSVYGELTDSGQMVQNYNC